MKKYLSTNLESDSIFIQYLNGDKFVLRINPLRNGNLDLVLLKTNKVVCEFQNNEVEE